MAERYLLTAVTVIFGILATILVYGTVSLHHIIENLQPTQCTTISFKEHQNEHPSYEIIVKYFVDGNSHEEKLITDQDYILGKSWTCYYDIRNPDRVHLQFPKLSSVNVCIVMIISICIYSLISVVIHLIFPSSEMLDETEPLLGINASRG